MKRLKCYPGKYWPKENCYNIISIRQNISLSENFSTNAKEAEVQQFYEYRKDLIELTTKKDVLFITGDWNAKLGSQEISGITSKYGLGVQNEAGQRLRVLPREHTGHSKHSLPTTQEIILHKGITRWSLSKSDWLYFLQSKMEKLYTVSKKK